MPSSVRRSFLLAAAATVLTVAVGFAQDALTSSTVSVVPHVIKYSGTLPQAPSAASVVEVKFALYATQSGGEPLWTETQQVALDPQSHYAVLLGAATPDGLPDALFSSGAAQWLGVTLSGQPEAPRSLLSANAYALKAVDAETLSGHPISDFKLATSGKGKPDTAAITQLTNTNGIVLTNGGTGPTVGIGLDLTYLGQQATACCALLKANNAFTGNQSITGNLLSSGTFTTLNGASKIAAGAAVDIAYANGVYTISLDGNQGEAFGNGLWAQLAAPNTFKAQQTLGALGAATTGGGFNSNALKFAASVYSSTSATAEAVNFLWQVEPSGNDTASASGSLNLLSSLGAAAPAETGFKIANSGTVTFANGQAFPGVPTNSGNNTFTGNQVINGTDTINGSSAGNGSYTSGQLTVTNSNTGATAVGISGNGVAIGVVGNGDATTGIGVQGQANLGVMGVGANGDAATFYGEGVGVLGSAGIGVLGEGVYTGSTKASIGVEGLINNSSPSGIAYGVYGLDQTGTGYYGVAGRSNKGVGTAGFSTSSNGVYGTTAGVNGSAGVYGASTTTTGGASGVAGTAVGASNAGVYGSSTGANGYGIFGNAAGSGVSVGVFGQGPTGVSGSSTSGNGVYGTSTNGNGVYGTTAATNGDAGVSGSSTTTTGGGAGVSGTAVGAFNAGVYGSSTGSNGFGIFGNSTAGDGIYGQTGSDSGYGVYGGNTSSTNTSDGVHAENASAAGYGVHAVGVSASTSGAAISGLGGAVWGDTASSGNVSFGAVIGTADDNDGGYFQNNSNTLAAVVAINSGNGGTVNAVPVIAALGRTGACGMNSAGDVTCSGRIKTAVPTAGGARQVEVYSVQSPENWFEDFGSAKLENGRVTVALDPQFAAIVNTGVEFHVFLTPQGECEGLYVANKASGGFEVRELHHGASSVAFDYRIVAKRNGHENERLADATAEMHNLTARRSAIARKQTTAVASLY